MKILIVDDDIALLDVIQKQVDWQGIGIDRVFTAENGEAAKALIEREHPDIVLSDISMPLCSGIDLIRYVSGHGIPCEFAFLTCYEEISYMREAMRNGARWYLTKPVNFTELDRELREIVQVVRGKEKKAGRMPSEDHLIAITVLRGLRDGLYGEDEELLEHTLENHGLSLRPQDPIRMIGIRINLPERSRPEHAPEDIPAPARALDPAASETESAAASRDSVRPVPVQEADSAGKEWFYSGPAPGKRDDKVYIRPITVLARQEIFGTGTLDHTLIDLDERKLTLTLFLIGDRKAEEELLARCRNFIRRCREQFGYSPVCVVGREGRLSETYTMAERLKERLHKLRFREGKAFSQNDTEDADGNPAGVEVSEEKLLQFFSQGDKPGFLRYISGCISQGTRGRSDSDAFMTLLHHRLLQACFRCIRDNGFSHDELFSGDELRAADQAAEHSGFEMLRYGEMLFEQVNTLLRQIEQSADAVELAMQYIKKHYAENIDREEIARAACVAPNYLSKLFHEKAGISLREYINHMRMEEAKRLLLTTQKSIGEVAGEVGFDNISYFSTVFRKLVGVSPAEWKNSSR